MTAWDIKIALCMCVCVECISFSACMDRHFWQNQELLFPTRKIAMVRVALLGLLGLVGTYAQPCGQPACGQPVQFVQTAEAVYDTNLQALQAIPDLQRRQVEQLPYEKGHALFHDNFSPYDYNYYHERRHRINFVLEKQQAQKRLQWEGVEKQGARFAWEQKKQTQGHLPNSPTNPSYGASSTANPQATITYDAPPGYPEQFSTHGLLVEPAIVPAQYLGAFAPGFETYR